jgi:glycerol-3-phosphate acyltransferase PlsY
LQILITKYKIFIIKGGDVLNPLEFFLFIASLIIGYLIGSINPGYIFGRIVKKIDLRKVGTKNAGTSNTYKMLGIKYAVPTALYDIFKAIIAIIITLLMGFDTFWAQFSGIMAIIGHIFPFYLNFRGGRGVATAIGMWLFYVGLYCYLNLIFIFMVLYFVILATIFSYITRRFNLIPITSFSLMIIFVFIHYSDFNLLYNIWFTLIVVHIIVFTMIDFFTEVEIKIEDESFTGHKWRIVLRFGTIIFLFFYEFYSREFSLICIGAFALLFISLDFRRLIRDFKKKNDEDKTSKVDALYRAKEHKKFSSISVYLVAYIIVLMIFDKPIAMTAATFLIFGDTFGKFFGLAFGKHKILNKTLEGSLAYLGVMLISGYLLFELLHISPIVLILGGISAPITELLSLDMNDNFTVPIISGAIMQVAFVSLGGL